MENRFGYVSTLRLLRGYFLLCMMLLAVLFLGLFALGFARYLVLAVFLGGCFGDVFLLARFGFSEHNYPFPPTRLCGDFFLCLTV